MKMQLTFTALLILLLSSCGKDAGVSVDEYIALNNLTTTELAEGVHIIIDELGNNDRPTINTKVEVSYEGRLTDGDVFDMQDNVEISMNGVIQGWRIGLQEIGVGGKCTLIIPSEAGYGSEGNSSIPGGATLIFDIELHDVIL